VSEKVEKLAQTYARKISESLGLEGVFAIEFFLDQNGELLVNEVAPRVHNSGHFTLLASQTSQFENHVRVAVGLETGSTKTKSPYGNERGAPVGAPQ
jgi:5-(carboxyamino)imidazole ribonucleotide synthase